MRRSAAFAAALLGLAVSASAQTSYERGLTDSKRQLSQRTTAGGDFPTWERDVNANERAPLPTGRPGRYVPAWTLELGVQTPGAAWIGGDAFVVPLRDGDVRIIDVNGIEISRLRADAPVTIAPVSAGDLALVAAGERLLAVRRDGMAWRSQPGGRISRVPVIGGEAAYIVREGGTLERLALSDGHREWSAALGAEAGTDPAAGSSVVAVGIAGDVVLLSTATGEQLARIPVGDRVDALTVSRAALFASGMGVSGRAKDVTPIAFGLSLSQKDGRPDGHPWRLRVGGACTAPPLLLDDLVAFACADGYVRAVERGKGVARWKTDLPSATRAQPVLTGGRLDVVIPQSRQAVALQSDNGAVLGWIELPDEDETFTGVAAAGAGITVTPTSFARLLAWRWEWTPEDASGEGGEGEPYKRPGEDDTMEGRTGYAAGPFIR